MGQSTSSISTEVLQNQINRSNTLLLKREKAKKVYSSMISRVLTSPKHQTFDLALLPDSGIFSVLEFLADEIPKLLSVSALWYFKITEVMDHAFNTIESQFALIHSHLFTFKTSYQSIQKISTTGKKGFRMDRVIVIEVLPILAHHTIKLRYLYKTHSGAQAFKAEFKADCVKEGRRKIWAHRDYSRQNGCDDKAYSQQIPAICIGDSIEFCINWYSLVGLVRTDSIKWQPPLIQDTRAIQRILKNVPDEIPRNEYDPYQKKAYLYKMSRNCEVDIPEIEWYDSKYYSIPSRAICFDNFLPFLKLVKFEYANSDVVLSKNIFRAEKIGIVPDSSKIFGVSVEIKENDIRQEVKRMGLLYDRHRPIELRVGDIFIMYLSS